jgi:Fur family transcriptional regulator, peroxide stress response regulator
MMAPQKRMARMRDAGVTPTMQRLAILEYLEGTKAHPTADEIYAAMREKYPTIARATVYNTLEALSKAGTILKLSVDPAAARYDADTGPHVHFRCRICGKVHDIDTKESRCLGHEVNGHQVESVRTYAFGVCASCRGDASPVGEPPSAEHERASTRKPLAKTAPENGPRGRSPKASDTGDRLKKTESSSSEPPAAKRREVRHAP